MHVKIDRLLLRRARFLKGLTLKKLASISGIPCSTVNHYELGRISPSKERFKKLCKVLDLKEGDLKC